jgi:alkanesulfonate monooxygenase SsuD/methylene tetrahydromethanopterin reductase-like flavin-dependent oxidoreductase (luciferase family)
MNTRSFGWIIQTIARGDARVESLLEQNQAYIHRLVGPFDSLWFDGHFHKDRAPILESWTTLCYLASQFPQLHFGTLVLCHSCRNPALTAKMMATLQQLTGGSPDKVLAHIRAYIDLGVSRFMLRFLDFRRPDGLLRFTDEVISRL